MAREGAADRVIPIVHAANIDPSRSVTPCHHARYIGANVTTFHHVAFTGNVEEDLLSITAVHPMREDAVSAFLARAGADWPVIQRLIDQGQLVKVFHEGREFYVRKLF